jgi:lysophospholipid acyltransferase (LPLAT)-like uncharacterized protein
MTDSASDVEDEEAPRAFAPPQPERRSRSHRFKTWRRRFGRSIAATIGPSLVRVLARTWRVEIEGVEHLAAVRARGGYFMALWHGSMLLPAVHHGRQGYCVLVSPSADGDISEAMLRRFGYGVVRGSTSRQSRAALRALLDLLRRDTPIVITPDGPRGPRRSMSGGLAWLASATGHPVIACGFVARNPWRLASWDRFAIPKPFARVAFVYAAPIHVDRRAEGGLDAATSRIRDALLDAERRAARRVGTEPDP